MTLLNYGNGSDMNVKPMPKQGYMALLNGDDDDETTIKNVCKKRKQSLLKKTEELSMLCGVEACAIVYGPNDPRPVIWPSELGVENVLRKFMSMPQLEQSKKMVNQESFIAQRIMKSKEKLQKIVKENKEIEMSLFMAHCFKTGMFQPDINMTTADMNVLSSIIEQNLKDIDKRMEMLKANQVIPNQPDVETSTLQPQIMHTLTYQPPMQTFAFQPQIQISEFQTQIQTPEFPTQTYQSKMQTQTFQPQMQSPALFQPRMQSPAFFQPQIMQTPSYQPHTQTPALEDMTLLNYGNGLGMQMQQFNGNGYETTMPAFGGANFPL
ncbi:Agamous-like MADS-box protein AGL80 [Glycine max]|nr:Agamous-like MADS-box protein AGL80 [Glycine max]